MYRELAAGRSAMDVLVTYGPNRFALGIKRVRTRDALATVVETGVNPLVRDLDTVGLDHGWWDMFDLRGAEVTIAGEHVRTLAAYVLARRELGAAGGWRCSRRPPPAAFRRASNDAIVVSGEQRARSPS